MSELQKDENPLVNHNKRKMVISFSVDTLFFACNGHKLKIDIPWPYLSYSPGVSTQECMRHCIEMNSIATPLVYEDV